MDLHEWGLWRSASRRYNVRCGDCGRILGVARVLAGAEGEQLDLEWVRFRPDAAGEVHAVVSRPKVKWAKTADGRVAVRCPCGMGRVVSTAEIAELYRQAMAVGAMEIVLAR